MFALGVWLRAFFCLRWIIVMPARQQRKFRFEVKAAFTDKLIFALVTFLLVC